MANSTAFYAAPPHLPRHVRLPDLAIADLECRELAAALTEGIDALDEAELRRVLAGRPPAEVRRRIELLLEGNASHLLYPTPDRLRQERAIEVLEQIGDAPARRLLGLLAQGAAAAALTRDAKGALERLTTATVMP